MILQQPLFWGKRKIAQIGQTELIMPIYRHYQVTRRRTWVRREAKFVQNTRHSIAEIRQMTNSHLDFCVILDLHLQPKGFVKLFFCLVWCVHFATAPFSQGSAVSDKPHRRERPMCRSVLQNVFYFCLFQDTCCTVFIKIKNEILMLLKKSSGNHICCSFSLDCVFNCFSLYCVRYA